MVLFLSICNFTDSYLTAIIVISLLYSFHGNKSTNKKNVPTYYEKKFLPLLIQDVAFLRMYRIYIQFKIISMVWE